MVLSVWARQAALHNPKRWFPTRAVAKGPAAVELYAHTGDAEADFDAFENENVAAANAAVVAQHLAIATQQWAKPSA